MSPIRRVSVIFRHMVHQFVGCTERDTLLVLCCIFYLSCAKSITYAPSTLNRKKLRIGSCLAYVYRVMDARGKFDEHERSVRVAHQKCKSCSSVAQ